MIRWLTELFRFNSGTGHYTQVVWAATEELGCGMVYYQVRQISLIIINLRAQYIAGRLLL